MRLNPDLGLSFSTRHQQMEQGGTSAVLIHQLKLARRTQDYETVVNLIAATTTTTGLAVPPVDFRVPGRPQGARKTGNHQFVSNDHGD